MRFTALVSKTSVSANSTTRVCGQFNDVSRSALVFNPVLSKTSVIMEEAEGFEPPMPVKALQFSRLLHTPMLALPSSYCKLRSTYRLYRLPRNVNSIGGRMSRGLFCIVYTLTYKWRKLWDSNPWNLSAHPFSKRAPSASQPSFLSPRSGVGYPHPRIWCKRKELNPQSHVGAPSLQPGLVANPRLHVEQFSVWELARCSGRLIFGTDRRNRTLSTGFGGQVVAMTLICVWSRAGNRTQFTRL